MIIVLVMSDTSDGRRSVLQLCRDKENGNGSSDGEASSSSAEQSCDEGPSSPSQEKVALSEVIKKVTDIFSDGRSTSKPASMTTSDASRDGREGWLKYKQILTEKGKKMCCSMRPWKRVFTVLRSQSLFFYKNKCKVDGGSEPDVLSPINIGDCLVDVAYGESRHQHTLRLVTQNFCEYLLEAESCGDMLAWIKVIRERSVNGKEEISSSGRALINKKMNDYRKQRLIYGTPKSSPKLHCMSFLLAKAGHTSVKRSSRQDDAKSPSSANMTTKRKKTPQVMGVRLEDCLPALNHKFVPLVVEMCCGVIEATGLECTGIYRIPGNSAMIANLLEHLNMGLDINTAEERWRDQNVVSSLLKAFFRNLPEPLLTDDRYMDFINTNHVRNTDARLKALKKLIRDLPDHHYHTLKFLLDHLKRVAENSENNKMDSRNLALVFGPTLVRSSVNNMADMVTQMPDQYMIVETMILHYDWMFSDAALEDEVEALEESLNLPVVPNIIYLLSNIGKPGIQDASDSLSNSLRSGTLRH
ncbi:rho GTPase-activating protein 23-like [Synchiropus splendidus]|uniref:rho GTPase-activating protein 23-like n=1 Tax=Synchiropus splendidus TaxID=270530 RepID=UPI00237E7B76|nr:rho GTPase-activating protein 23-like [Synchiropus splendidus]